MPSKSAAQARLMAAAAHTPGGYGGVPQSVGKEFNKADKGTGIRKQKPDRVEGRKMAEELAARVDEKGDRMLKGKPKRKGVLGKRVDESDEHDGRDGS